MMLAANRHIKHTSVSHSAGWRRNVAVPGRGFAAAAAAQQKQNQKQQKKKEVSPYKDTILLPTTSFQLRGNSPVREPQIHKQWEERRIYERLAIERKDAQTFKLHDGPPYANGSLHMGHALNKVLKDFINRYHLLQGKRARYVPGWDTRSTRCSRTSSTGTTSCRESVRGMCQDGTRAQQGAQGLHQQVPPPAGKACAVCARMGHARTSHRAEGAAGHEAGGACQAHVHQAARKGAQVCAQDGGRAARSVQEVWHLGGLGRAVPHARQGVR